MTDSAQNQESADTEASTARLVGLVAEVVEELHPGQSVAGDLLDQSLERDLALDSLARAELMHRIEATFGVVLPDRLITEADTPRDLLRAIGTQRVVAPNNPSAPQNEGAEVIAPAPSTQTVLRPDSATTLVDVLSWHAEHQPDRLHVRLFSDDAAPDDEAGELMTYGELWAGARAVAGGLRANDLAPDETVLLMLPTGMDYFRCFFGVLLAGGIPVPVYPPGRPSQLEEHLRRHGKIADNAQAGIMITVPEAKAFSRLMIGLAPTLRHILTPEELAAEPPLTGMPIRRPDDIAFLQYTSGSTGDPKGVILSHANLLANIRAMGQALGAEPDDVMVSWLPLYHDMGLIGAWLGSLYFGIPLVIMSPLTFLARPERWLRAIDRYRGTISGAPNFAYEACANRVSDSVLEELDLSSWRVAFNGAEAVSPTTVDAFCSRFAGAGFRRESMMPVYGLAENCVGLAFPPLDRGPIYDHVERAALMSSGRAIPAGADDNNPLIVPACGFPIPRHQIRIADNDGRELPDRIQGRIQFQGPSSTSGYHRNPEASAELFDGPWRDSRDLGYMVDGEIYITGRAKDMIIRGGRNIYPVELEDAVGEIDGIQRGNVAAFGSIDTENGAERLIVMAEARRRGDEAHEKLRTEINRIAIDLVGMPPDHVAIVPPRSVPKTSSGKIRRQAAKALFETGRAGDAPGSVRLQVFRLALAGIGPTVGRSMRIAGAWVYGIYAWLLLLLSAPPLWLLVAVCPSPRLAWWFVRRVVKILRALLGIKITIEGAENLSKAGGIIVANHSSYLDGPVLIAGLPDQFAFVAKSELKSSIVPAVFLKRLGTLFVERFAADQSLADAEQINNEIVGNRSVLYFPEGTFSRMPGLLPFRMGAFTAAVETGAPIYPVSVRGTRQILRDKTILPRRGAVRIIIGPPITAPTDTAAEKWAAALTLRDNVRATLLQHIGEPDLSYERVVPETAPDRLSEAKQP